MNNAECVRRSDEPVSAGKQRVDPEFDVSGPPMRVLHVLNSISPSKGGPVQSLWFLLKASAMCGIQTVVATTNENGPNDRADVPFAQPVDVHGFRVLYFPCQTNFYTASAPMLRWLWMHVRDFDVVHVHALFSFAPVAAAYCARLRGVPYVVSPHGVLNTWGRENRRPVLKRASIRWVETPLLRHAASVQFSSRQEIEEFGQLGVKVRADVIPHPMPSEDDSLLRRGFQPAQALVALEGRPAILFLARIHPIKGLDLLLRAFAGIIQRHPTAVLLVAGEGEATLVAGLRELAANLGIAQSIQWIGFVKGPLKHWLLERANVFVLPSWSENFGVAVAEAMAAGVPVVVTKGVGIADIVAASNCGLVTECSVPALEQAIDSLLLDGVARLRMGKAGKDAVREQLSIETHSGHLKRMYWSAAGRCQVEG
jgi:glycosyltransferase involved in cell wall biosynthesis